MNEELIKAVREVANWIVAMSYNSEYAHDELKMLHYEDSIRAAADALEAAEKKIVELEKQMPKRGEWIEKWRFKTDGTPFHKIGDMECSVCHGDMLGRYYSKYCPHCGALLRG